MAYNNGIDGKSLLDEISKVIDAAAGQYREAGEDAGEEYIEGVIDGIKKHSKEAKSEIAKIYEDFNKTTNNFKSRKSVTQAEWTRILGLSKELMKSERYADRVREKLSDISVTLKNGTKVSGLEKVLEEWTKVGGLVESVQWAEAGKNYRKKPSTKKPKVETPVVQADPTPVVKAEEKKQEAIENTTAAIVKQGEAIEKVVKRVPKMESIIKRYNNLVSSVCRPEYSTEVYDGEDKSDWKVGDMVKKAKMLLETYYEEGHANYEMKDESAEAHKAWVSEIGKLKRFIATYEPYIDVIQTTVSEVQQVPTVIEKQTEALQQQASAAESAAKAQEKYNQRISEIKDKYSKPIKEQKALISNQEAWIKYLDGSLDESKFKTTGKKAATDQLRTLTNYMANSRLNNYKNAIGEYPKEMAEVAWMRGYQEAERQGVASSVLNRYDTDAKYDFNANLKKLQDEYNYRKKVMDAAYEELQRLYLERNKEGFAAFADNLMPDGPQSDAESKVLSEITEQVANKTLEYSDAKEKLEKSIMTLRNMASSEVKMNLNTLVDDLKKTYGDKRFNSIFGADLKMFDDFDKIDDAGAKELYDTLIEGNQKYQEEHERAKKKLKELEEQQNKINNVPISAQNYQELKAVLEECEKLAGKMAKQQKPEIIDIVESGFFKPIDHSYLTDENKEISVITDAWNEYKKLKGTVDSTDETLIHAEKTVTALAVSYARAHKELSAFNNEELETFARNKHLEYKRERIGYESEWGQYGTKTRVNDEIFNKLSTVRSKLLWDGGKQIFSDDVHDQLLNAINQIILKGGKANDVLDDMANLMDLAIDNQNSDSKAQKEIEAVRLEAEQFIAKCKEIQNQEVFDGIDCDKLISELSTVLSKLKEIAEQRDITFGAHDPEWEFEAAKSQLEYQKRVAEAAKEGIVYHAGVLGNVGQTMKSRPLGSVVPEKRGDYNSLTGLYTTPDWDGFIGNEWSGAPISTIDINQYKLFDARRKSIALQAHQFFDNLNGTIYGYQEYFDNEAQEMAKTTDVKSIESLYEEFKSVFINAEMSFEQFTAFIKESAAIVKGHDFKPIDYVDIDEGVGKSYSTSALQGVSKEIFNSDSFSTRLMKMLGYEGLDTRGSGFDSTYKGGTVIFDVKPESIISTDGKWSELMSRHGVELDEKSLEIEEKRRQLAFETAKAYSQQADVVTNISSADAKAKLTAIQRQAYNYRRPTDNDKALAERESTLTEKLNEIESIKKEFPELEKACTSAEKAVSKTLDTLHRANVDTNDETVGNELKDTFDIIQQGESATAKFETTANTVHEALRKMRDALPEDRQAWGSYIDKMLASGDDRAIDTFKSISGSIGDHSELYKMDNLGDGRVAVTFSGIKGAIQEANAEVENLGDQHSNVTQQIINDENKLQNELEETKRIEERRMKQIEAFAPASASLFGDDAYRSVSFDDKEALYVKFATAIYEDGMLASDAMDQLYLSMEALRKQSEAMPDDIIESFGGNSEQVAETVSQLQKLSSVDVTRIFDSVDLKAFLEMFNIDKSNFATFKTLFEELMQITKAMGDGVDVGNAFDVKMAEITDTIMRLGGHMIDLDDGGYATMMQDFYKHMSNIKMQFNDTIKSEYTKDQWKSLYRTNKNRLTSDVTKGIPVDSLYQELNDKWPGLFPESENQQADFKLIIERLDEARKLQANNWKVLQGFVSSDRDSIQGSVDDLYEKMSDALFVSKEIETTKVESDVDKNLDSIKHATEEQSDDLEQQIAAAEQAKENLDKAFQNVKSASSRAVLKGQTKADFEDFARQIANDSGMELGTVAVSRDEMDQMRIASIKLLNKELAQSITYTYDIQENAEGVNEAFLRSSYAIGDANKALENARKKEEQDAKKKLQNDTWLYAQRGKLDTQQRRYTDPDRGIDGKTSIMSTETSLADDAEHTIESLANHIRENIKKSLSDGLTDEVKRKIISDLEILENEIKVRQSETYSSTTMKSSQFETNKKAYQEYMKAFTARAQKSGVFPQMSKTISDLNTELNSVSDAKCFSQFVDNFKIARNKLQAEIAELSRDTKTLQSQLSAFSNEEKAYNKIFANVRAIGEDNIGDGFAQKISAYQNAIVDLRKAMDNLKANPEDSDHSLHKAFDDAAFKVKNARVEIESILKESQKLDQVMANMDVFGSKNLDPSELKSLQQAMLSFASSVEDGVFKFKGFNKAGTEMYGTLEQSSGAIKNVTVALKQSSDQLFMYGTNANRADNEWEEFKNTLASGTKNLVGMYVGFQEGVQAIRSGVEAVKQIDLAMTELKKVTDETDDSYREFLEDAGRTSAVIGSTVSDFAEASATFARLGYSLDEASSMAETAIVYKNVAD